MEAERAYRLIARVAPRGYDPSTRTFGPWWWPRARYDVAVRGEGVPHFFGSKIVVAGVGDGCPHAVAHGFVHEAGHVQMLMFDILVFSVTVKALDGASWIAYVVAFLVWQFAWRELTADLYAATKLGPRNVVLGYTHEWRARRTPAATASAGTGSE
jgi:hypothetical protein